MKQAILAVLLVATIPLQIAELLLRAAGWLAEGTLRILVAHQHGSSKRGTLKELRAATRHPNCFRRSLTWRAWDSSPIPTPVLPPQLAWRIRESLRDGWLRQSEVYLFGGPDIMMMIQPPPPPPPQRQQRPRRRQRHATAHKE